MKKQTIIRAIFASALILAVGVFGMALKAFDTGVLIQREAIRVNTFNALSTGTATLAGPTAISGALTQSQRILANTAVALTSPTTTFSVASATERVTLTSTNSITGITITGAALGQVILIVAGTDGTNTMQFDDGTSYTLGGNRVLTEAAGSVLGLLCTSADGDDFTQLFFSAN